MSLSQDPVFTSGQAVDRNLVLSQLSRILASPGFAESQRRRDLLSYLVSALLEGPDVPITERMLAAVIYGRNDGFDPAQDATVRVEMSRLRAALDRYYSQAGVGDPVVLSIPRGSYAASVWVVPAKPDTTAPSPTGAVPTAAPRQAPSRIQWVAAGLLAVVLAGAWEWLGSRSVPEVQRITSLPGLQVQPSLSPNGKDIAFAWDATGSGRFDIFRKPLYGGRIVRLTSAGTANRSPSWSPDGRWIAFLRSVPARRQEIYLIPSAGGPERLITTIQTTVVGIAWTPDSRHLIAPDSPPGQPLALVLISTETGDRVQLTDFESFFQPAVSPDGRTLAFVTDKDPNRRHRICLLPLDAGYHAAGPVRFLDATATRTGGQPTWSEDGRSLYYTSGFNGSGVLMRLKLATGEVKPVPEAGRDIGYGRALSGGRFLLTRRRELTSLVQVTPAVPGAAAPAPAPLFRSVEPDYNGAISPDMQRVAFLSRRNGVEEMWMADLSGENESPIQLPAGLAPREPRWAPDSRSFYFRGAMGNGGRSRIFRVSLGAAGEGAPSAEALNLDDAQDVSPSVSRDGRWLYFGSNRSGAYQLWRVALPHGTPELVTAESTLDDRVIFGEESSDGQWLYYSYGKGIWRKSLKDGATERFLDVGPGVFRVAADGIYYELFGGDLGSPIHFHPFDPKASEMVALTGDRRAWSPLPSGLGLLVSSVRAEANIEMYTPR